MSGVRLLSWLLLSLALIDVMHAGKKKGKGGKGKGGKTVDECCRDEVSLIEYELALNDNLLTFQTWEVFDDLLTWLKRNVQQSELFDGQINLIVDRKNRKEFSRVMDRVMIFNRGSSDAPAVSDVRYFRTFGGGSEDYYQNYLQWRIHMSPDDMCEVRDITPTPDFERPFVDEINQFVWVMPCMPDASDCSNGVTRQESTVYFQRMEEYGTDDTTSVEVVDVSVWETEDIASIASQLDTYYSDFSSVYDGRKISVRYNRVYHSVLWIPVEIYSTSDGTRVSRGIFELQARFDDYDSFVADKPSAEASQLKFRFWKDKTTDWDLLKSIVIPIVDYIGNEAKPYVDHNDCLECCDNNMTFAEYEVSLDNTFLQTVGTFTAFNDYIADILEDVVEADVFNGQFEVVSPSIVQYSRAFYSAVFLKRGTTGPAPTKSYLKYYRSLTDESVYQHDLSWIIEREEDCSQPYGMSVTDEFDVEVETGAVVKENIDRNVWVMPCMPDASNCTDDVYTWQLKIQFDQMEEYPESSPNLIDFDGVWATEDLDTICTDAERFFVDFCDYYSGSSVTVRYKELYHRFLGAVIWLYQDGEKVARGKVEFQARYDTWDNYVDDIPSPHATNVKLRIFDFQLEAPDLWGEAEMITEDVIDYLAANSGDYVDYSDCPMCCNAIKVKPDGVPPGLKPGPPPKGPRWKSICPEYTTSSTCVAGKRAGHCEWAMCPIEIMADIFAAEAHSDLYLEEAQKEVASAKEEAQGFIPWQYLKWFLLAILCCVVTLVGYKVFQPSKDVSSYEPLLRAKHSSQYQSIQS